MNLFDEEKRRCPLSEEDGTIVEVITKRFFSGEVLLRFSHPHLVIAIYLKNYNTHFATTNPKCLLLQNAVLDYLYVLHPPSVELDTPIFFGESEESVFAQAELFSMLQNGEITKRH